MNASKTAQALFNMNNAASSFQDHLIVYSSSFNQHLKDLKEVLTRLRNANLTGNVNKCCFVVKKLNLLDYVIEDELIKPTDEKLSVIAELNGQLLTTKKHIKSVCGLINFFRNFIPKCAKLLLPVTAMLKKNIPDKIK